jgi:polysaccharide biosynthesis protein PslG
VRPLTVLLVAAAALAAAPSAQAARVPRIGIGEQDPIMFSSPLWRALRISDVRVVVSWDGLHRNWERADLDQYMAAARAAHAHVLLGFGLSRGPGHEHKLPSVKRYAREFKRFRARYPWVRDYITWNEANHCGQVSCKHPEQIARYYNAISRICRKCGIVGADVLDSSKIVPWIKRFRHVARGKHLIWGIHNYIDANRHYSRGTKRLLRAVRGQVWFTETGGVVARHNGSSIKLRTSPKLAARATKWVFHLARLSSRVRRIYFYEWKPGPGHPPHWDSGLTDRRGHPRPAYKVLAQWLRAHRPPK